MAINRDFFLEHIRHHLFPSGLRQSQIDGHEAILDAWEATMAKEDDRWLAYMLGTAYHETARTLEPVRETLATSDEQAAARLENAWRRGRLTWVKHPYWRKDQNGHYWFGRGLVQLTHEKNYEKMGNNIGQNLAAHPELALQMDVSIEILFYGMTHGSFTTKKLADYFHGGRADWVQARHIVNGLDRADDIATYAKAYYAALSYTTA